MLATVASITSANRIKKRAAQFGVNASVLQTPSVLAKEGCGYSLRFDANHKNYIAASAAELDIKIRAFFEESGSGTEKKYQKV